MAVCETVGIPNGLFEQAITRPACACAQSDQSIPYPHEYGESKQMKGELGAMLVDYSFPYL